MQWLLSFVISQAGDILKRWEIYLEILMEFLIFAAILLFIGLGLPKLLAFFWPVAAAAILAMITNPMKRFLETHLKLPRQIGATLMIILLLAAVSFAVYWLIVAIAAGAGRLSQMVPELYERLMISLSDVVDRITEFVNGYNAGMAEKIEETFYALGMELGSAIARLGSQNVGVLGGVATSVTNGIVGIIVMFMSAYFILIYYDNIRYFFHEIKDEKLRNNLSIIYNNVLGSVGKYILSQLKLMLIIALILLAGLLILQRSQPLLLAFLIALLDAVPFFGTGTVLCPWSAVCLIQGDYYIGAGLILLYIICLLSRQILQPKIIGDTIGMNPFVTLILMYAGTRIAGLVGFVLAVLIGIIVYKLYINGLFDGMLERMKHRFHMLREMD